MQFLKRAPGVLHLIGSVSGRDVIFLAIPSKSCLPEKTYETKSSYNLLYKLPYGDHKSVISSISLNVPHFCVSKFLYLNISHYLKKNCYIILLDNEWNMWSRPCKALGELCGKKKIRLDKYLIVNNYGLKILIKIWIIINS